MCSDQELNSQPFGLQDDTPTNWDIPTRAISLKILKGKIKIPQKEETAGETWLYDKWRAYFWVEKLKTHFLVFSAIDLEATHIEPAFFIQ